MTNIVKYGEIDGPYFLTYNRLCEKIVEESIKVKKYYQKTLFLNVNLSCNDFINLLRKTIGKDFLIARDADNAFHCLFEDNTILLYSRMSKRPEYNYYMLGVEAYTLEGLNKFAADIEEATKQYAVSYPTIDIRWYYNTSNGIDFNIFDEKAVSDINPLAYPYYSDLKSYIDDYINSSESVLILLGKPGTGKTSLIRYIIGRYQELKNPTESVSESTTVYYTADQEVLSADMMFIHYAAERNACMVMEDIDIHLSSRSDGNTFMYKLLGSSDGLIKNIDRKIIISTNLPNVRDVDDALIRTGRCFGIKEHRELTYNEALAFLQDTNPKYANKFLDFDKKKTYPLSDLYSVRLFSE